MFKRQRPETRPPHLAWDHAKVPPGGSLVAHKVGPPVGVHTHFGKTSKPCRKKMTEGGLKCVCDERDIRLHFVVYLPVVDEEQRRLVVCPNREYLQALEDYPHLTVLKFTRGTGGKDVVQVKPQKDTARSPLIATRWPQPVDISELLFYWWQEPELEAWCKAHPPREEPAAKPAPASSPRPTPGQPPPKDEAYTIEMREGAVLKMAEWKKRREEYLKGLFDKPNGAK